VENQLLTTANTNSHIFYTVFGAEGSLNSVDGKTTITGRAKYGNGDVH